MISSSFVYNLIHWKLIEYLKQILFLLAPIGVVVVSEKSYEIGIEFGLDGSWCVDPKCWVEETVVQKLQSRKKTPMK